MLLFFGSRIRSEKGIFQTLTLAQTLNLTFTLLKYEKPNVYRLLIVNIV